MRSRSSLNPGTVIIGCTAQNKELNHMALAKNTLRYIRQARPGNCALVLPNVKGMQNLLAYKVEI